MIIEKMTEKRARAINDSCGHGLNWIEVPADARAFGKAEGYLEAKAQDQAEIKELKSGIEKLQIGIEQLKEANLGLKELNGELVEALREISKSTSNYAYKAPEQEDERIRILSATWGQIANIAIAKVEGRG